MESTEPTTPKIKVVVGINDFIVGGGQRLLVDFFRYANHERFDYSLVTLKQHENVEDFYDQIPSQVTVCKLNFNGLYDVNGWRTLYRTLSDIRPQVVWSHMFFGNAVFRVLKLFFGYRVISNEHNTYTKKTFSQKLTDKILSYITYRIVAVSDTVATFTSKQERIPLKKFSVIPNGVDVSSIDAARNSVNPDELRTPLGITAEKKIVINTARLMKQKNQELLIRAFALFEKENPEYVLMIVGGGPMEEYLRDLVAELGVKEKVYFVGVRRDVPALLSISDFFVLSSSAEGFGIVCIEAMACGLPVISTRTAGPDVYVKDGVNGYLVDDNPEAMCEKMSIIANADEATLEQVREGARTTAQAYDIKKTAARYESLF